MKTQTENPLWSPTESFKNSSNLKKYMDWLQQHENFSFDNYDELWRWSVENSKQFWQSVWRYFKVISHTPFEEVHTDDPMPATRWFPGSTLNYAEHIFRCKTDSHPAIIFKSETEPLQSISWVELEQKVAALATYLKSIGIEKGDRVIAYLPNIPEATIAFLAVCSIGAVWSSCSPDFGINAVVERFLQIEPKVLIAADGYSYGGKHFDKQSVILDLQEKIPTIATTIVVSPQSRNLENAITWQDVMEIKPGPLRFEAVPFDHPIWVLYSSGTTGIPKAITHSHGGVLLEHLKYLTFHNDVKPGERFFWFSTTGWMMWNFVQASLLAGATIVLYDGSPNFPDLNALWQFADEAKIDHFGTSAPFILACMKQGISPVKFNLSRLRSVSSTGAPLPPEGFAWLYENVKQDLWFCSMSGGTDVCTAFVGGCPLEPVYAGEIQCRALGCSLFAFNELGEKIADEVGEMVITQPMPSMPVYFWNDENGAKYKASYFEMFDEIWRHGDWVKITACNTIVILGRSDATLNRQGIRIGTAEIYRVVEKLPEIKDSLIVNLELPNGEHYMPLFVVLNSGFALDEALSKKLKAALRGECSPRHVPDEIIKMPEAPYTISGKKLEAPVKKILLGAPAEKVASAESLRNPSALSFFVDWRKESMTDSVI